MPSGAAVLTISEVLGPVDDYAASTVPSIEQLRLAVERDEDDPAEVRGFNSTFGTPALRGSSSDQP
jgi:hypothetical protein